MREERLIIRLFVQNHRAIVQCYLCCFIHAHRIYKGESTGSQITVLPVMEMLASERVRLLRHTFFCFFFIWGEAHLHYFFNRNLYLLVNDTIYLWKKKQTITVGPWIQKPIKTRITKLMAKLYTNKHRGNITDRRTLGTQPQR